MNRNFGRGTNNAVQEITGGVVSSLIVNAFATTGMIPAEYMLLINLANGLATVALLASFPYLGATYLFGWFFGMYLMLQSGLMSTVDVIAYIVLPLLYVAYRGYNYVTGN